MKRRVKDGLYAVTSCGETRYYFAEKFGSLVDLLAWMYTVRTERDRLPAISTPEARRLVQYSKKRTPIVRWDSESVFEPLEPEEYAFLWEEMQYRDQNCVHYALDYDQDRFRWSSWGGDGLTTLSAPMGQMLNAYRAALRDKNATQRYVNEKALSAELEKIVTLEPACPAQEQTPGGQSMDIR